jgi:hypothetical protein
MGQKVKRYRPGRWVTFWTGNMGDTLAPATDPPNQTSCGPPTSKGISARETRCIAIRSRVFRRLPHRARYVFVDPRRARIDVAVAAARAEGFGLAEEGAAIPP